jgi:hypothetical protein
MKFLGSDGGRLGRIKNLEEVYQAAMEDNQVKVGPL